MRKKFLFPVFLMVLGGCFPMAAPERLPVYRSVDAARGVEERLFLDLSGQEGVTALPEGLSEVPGLEKFSIRGADLGVLGAELATLSQAGWIDMGRAGIRQLPPDVQQLARLHSWWLSDNHLVELPAEITSLPLLRYLNLDRNQLIQLPETIGALQDLRWLRLNANQLTELPASITRIQTLERLYLRDNQLTALPEDIGQLVNLDTLLLHGNPIPKEERDRIRTALPQCNIVFE